MSSNPSKGKTKAKANDASAESSRKLTATQRWLRQFKVFQIQAQVDKELRKEKPRSEFKKEFTSRLKTEHSEVKVPNNRILEALYERALDALVDQRHVQKVKEFRRSEEWKKHKKWIKDVEKQTQELARTLRSADWRLFRPWFKGRVKLTLTELYNLSGLLSSVISTDDGRLEWFAGLHIQSRKKQAAWRLMYLFLKRKLPHLTKTQIYGLIALVTEVTGLEPAKSAESSVSVEAVGRSVRRAQKRRSEQIKKEGEKRRVRK